MSTELANITAEATADASFTSKQLDLIKTTIAPGVSDNQLALFVEVAKRTGLDPFSRQIYAILRGGKMTIQTGIDGYRAIASRTGALAGIDDPTYDTEDGKHPNRASVTVWRFTQGQRVPFSATARWSEYKPDNAPMWDRMPYLMLGKCAEALALRKAFPNEISGVYTAEEMSQADTGEPEPPITRNPAGHAVNTATGEVVDAKAAQPATAKPADPWAEVRELAAHLALSDEERTALFTRHKKNRDRILAELRTRYAQQTDAAEAEPDVEYTVTTAEGRDLSELEMAHGGRLN